MRGVGGRAKGGKRASGAKAKGKGKKRAGGKRIRPVSAKVQRMDGQAMGRIQRSPNSPSPDRR